MEIRDCNGEGDWSKDEIIRRYELYAHEMGVHLPIDLLTVEYVEGTVMWIYPIMEKIITGIEQGDPACRRIGVEFIEQDQKFSFGKILKSNTARSLRRSDLTEDEKQRVARRIVDMLIEGNVPHEYKQYARLLKKIGVQDYWTEIEQRIDRSNGYVLKYYKYLKP